MTDISNLRREYKLQSLDEENMDADPIEMFRQWFQEAIDADVLEPNAMNLATSTLDGKPSSRIVLLKKITPDGLIFFTNYQSKKGKQLAENNHCALNFNWLELERQVRIEGIAEKTTPTQSDTYFEVRPLKSKLGAWASPQSEIISSRQNLDHMMAQMELKYPEQQSVLRPDNWGGYIVKPHLIEFWQGRPSRLHDRIQYTLKGDKWHIVRLAP